MRLLILVAAVTLLSGCPAGGGKPAANGAAKLSAKSALRVQLLRTDLGLADGDLVRDADSTLTDMSRRGLIEYKPVGTLPEKLSTEGGAGDVGLPDAQPAPGAKPAGLMKSADTDKLAAQLTDCDIVVVTGPLAAKPVLARIEGGTLKAGCVIMLDQEGPPLPKGGKAKLISIDYDIKEAAFLLGVAAGTSSRSQVFMAFTSSYDPQAGTFLKALKNGLRYRTNGANVLSAQLTPDADNIVHPDVFRSKLRELLDTPGAKLDHYIVCAGRATPSIMYALSSDPTNGYLLGGYGDFRQVRPARIVACIVKHPAVALHKLLDGAKSVADVQARAKDGRLQVGFTDGAVELTDLSAYRHYNPDAEDIADAVEGVRKQIKDGEIDVLK